MKGKKKKKTIAIEQVKCAKKNPIDWLLEQYIYVLLIVLCLGSMFSSSVSPATSSKFQVSVL